MGEMRDSDWSRRNLLRSDWLLPRVAIYTTATYVSKEDPKSQLILYAKGHIIFSNVLANKILFQIL